MMKGMLDDERHAVHVMKGMPISASKVFSIREADPLKVGLGRILVYQ